MAEFTLNKDQRLKSRKQIDAIFASGQSFSVFPFRVIYTRNAPGDEHPLKFGVSVPSRHFKKAVDRNLMKRRIREAWRLQRQPLDGQALHVFFIFTAKELADYNLIAEKMRICIQKLNHSDV